MKAILDHFGIDEKFTAPVQKPKFFNKIKDNIPLIKDYNQMADILYLPTTKQKFKYLLVVCDLASDMFDIQPMIEKDSDTTLKALEQIYKRKILNPPKGSMNTDGGTEFKGVFHKYLYSKNIFHKTGLAYRHSQQSVVENLNKQLARIFMGYLNKKELETKKSYHQWTDILDEVRKKLNFYKRDENLPKDITTYEYKPFMPLPENRKLKKIEIKEQNKTTDFNKAFEFVKKEPKKLEDNNNDNHNNVDKFEEPRYKIGDRVYVKLEVPYNVLGHKENTTNFRVGDVRFSKEVHIIKKVIFMNTKPWYRFIVNGINNCSYSAWELKPARHQKEATYIFKKIVGHKKINGIRHYKIWYKGELRKEASFQPEPQLIEDDLQNEINEYRQSKNINNNW